MKYMLIFNSVRDGSDDMPAWMAYIGAMYKEGVAVNGHGLEGPESATTVRVRGGERQIHDGPYAETREQIGGYMVIDVPDLDTAIGWAARCPIAASGAVEIRPVSVTPDAAGKA